MNAKDIVFATALACAASAVEAAILCGGDSLAVAIDLRSEPLVESVRITYDASWIGGDSGATVVISDNGAEVRRVTGAGEFTHTLADIGCHELTYTTLAGGVVQEEVYRAVVFKDWKYEVAGGGATITGTALQSGAVSVPAEIDGYPVTGIANSAFSDCSGLTSLILPFSLLGQISNLVIPGGCTVVIASDAIEGDGAPFAWTAGDSEAGWSIVADADAADGYVLRSDEIGSGETAAIEAIVDGPGRLDFDWRISANRGDYARIYVDGVQRAQITRSTAWAAASVAIDGDGPHTVLWAYEHRANAAANDNAAFLDNVAWHPMTLAEALDCGELAWGTDEGAEWTAQLTESSDGEDAAVSGPVDADGISGLETTVAGPGTLAWQWKLAAEGVSGLDVIVDGDFGNPARTYEESGNWAEDSLAFDDDGTHTIRFEFWNLGSVENDCAYLDCVSWTPAGGGVAGRDDLAEALDSTNLVFTVSGGDGYWVAQNIVSYDSEDAVRCDGVLADEPASVILSATATGPGELSFWWRIDNGGDDGFSFEFWEDGLCGIAGIMADGEGAPIIAGPDGNENVSCAVDGDWIKVAYQVGEGGHVFQWLVRTLSAYGGMFSMSGKRETGRGWLDHVSWRPVGEMAIPMVPLSATPEAVTNAIASAGFASSVAETLQDAIGGDAAKYNEFKAWAQAVKDGDGEAAGEAAVVASTNAAVSWLLGAEKLFVNEPTITIAEMSVAGNDGPVGNGDVAPPDGAALTIAVTVTDGGNPVAVASEKVRGMFESTSDLGDWEGDAKLTPGVEEITGGSGSTLRFRVTPDSTGNSDRAFLRVKVK